MSSYSLFLSERKPFAQALAWLELIWMLFWEVPLLITGLIRIPIPSATPFPPWALASAAAPMILWILTLGIGQPGCSNPSSGHRILLLHVGFVAVLPILSPLIWAIARGSIPHVLVVGGVYIPAVTLAKVAIMREWRRSLVASNIRNGT